MCVLVSLARLRRSSLNGAGSVARQLVMGSVSSWPRPYEDALRVDVENLEEEIGQTKNEGRNKKNLLLSSPG
jgi:hypothetical protein